MSKAYLKITEVEDIGVVTLSRPERRNAIDEDAIAEIDAWFGAVPAHLRAVVLTAEGDHFCAGLDLKEHHGKARSGLEFMRVCQVWHRAFDKIQHGGIPVIACMRGAVVGGGLELASAAHVRVADSSTYFALPEGTRGIFTGGGATVRTARIVSAHRMVEMMLTGRVIDHREALGLGLAHYISSDGATPVDVDRFGMQLARRIARNAPLSNYAIVSSINRIAEMSPTEGLFAEGLMIALVQSGDDVQARLGDFVDKRAQKVMPALADPASVG